MKKFLVVGVLVVFAFACVPLLFASEEGKQEEKVKLTVGTIFPPEQPASVAIEWAIEKIHERSNGNIEIEHFHSAQLGDAAEINDLAVEGAIDFNIQSLSFFEGQVPEVQIEGTFFAYEGMDHLKRAWAPGAGYGEFFRNTLLEKANTRIIIPWLYGWRVFTTSKRPVRTPADLKGLKIRAVPIPVMVDQMSAFGCDVVPVAFQEVYFALSQGVMDGQENPISVIYSNKFYEVQDYISLTNHMMDVIFVMINEDSWQSLTKNQQDIIEKAFIEASDVNTAEIEKGNAEGLDAFVKAGGTVIDDPDREAFRKLILPLFEPGGKYAHLGHLRDLLEEVK